MPAHEKKEAAPFGAASLASQQTVRLEAEACADIDEVRLNRLAEELTLIVQQDAEPWGELEVETRTGSHVILAEVLFRRVRREGLVDQADARLIVMLDVLALIAQANLGRDLGEVGVNLLTQRPTHTRDEGIIVA